jgi:hypothetical protein
MRLPLEQSYVVRMDSPAFISLLGMPAKPREEIRSRLDEIARASDHSGSLAHVEVHGYSVLYQVVIGKDGQKQLVIYTVTERGGA